MTESSRAIKKPAAKTAAAKGPAVSKPAAKKVAAKKVAAKKATAKKGEANASIEALAMTAVTMPVKAAVAKKGVMKSTIAAEAVAVAELTAVGAVAPVVEAPSDPLSTRVEGAVLSKAEVETVLEAVPMNADADDEAEEDEDHLIQEARVWQDDGWTARVIKNEDDDGWAVAMTLDGEPEPALVGPWTMGRDKKNPKPLDANAFSVLVKTAFEVRRRHEQQLHAMLHKSLIVDSDEGRIKVSLQIIPDEYEPHAFLRAHDDLGDLLAEVKVEAHFKLNNASANRWIDNAFRRPGD